MPKAAAALAASPKQLAELHTSIQRFPIGLASVAATFQAILAPYPL
jgi:hypothetical protein